MKAYLWKILAAAGAELRFGLPRLHRYDYTANAQGIAVNPYGVTFAKPGTQLAHPQ
jgi:hypothetical protein